MRGKAIGIFLVMLVTGLVIAAKTSVTDIEKFNWVSEKTATGGQPTIEQIGLLKHAGFRTIVNLRERSEYDAAAEEAAAKENGLDYVNIPVPREAPKAEQVDAFLKLMKDARPPVFIHCATANRVAAFWMIRRVVVDGWDLEDAEREAKVAGLKNEGTREFALGYINSHKAKS